MNKEVVNLKTFYFYRGPARTPRIRFRRIRISPRTRKKASDYVHYTTHKIAARDLILSRLQHFAAEYARLDPAYALAMQYRRVSIRNQRSRWGSCSAQKNLNFNYRLVHLSPELRDYVVVHELCHLVELNHGPKFWALVERMIPNAQKLSHHIRRVDMKSLAPILPTQLTYPTSSSASTPLQTP